MRSMRSMRSMRGGFICGFLFGFFSVHCPNCIINIHTHMHIDIHTSYIHTCMHAIHVYILVNALLLRLKQIPLWSNKNRLGLFFIDTCTIVFKKDVLDA